MTEAIFGVCWSEPASPDIVPCLGREIIKSKPGITAPYVLAYFTLIMPSILA